MNSIYTNYPESRRCIWIFKSPHNTTNIVNFCADNNQLNSFLTPFDIWRSTGKFELSSDGKYQEVFFEADEDFYSLSKSECFKNAIKHFDTSVFYDDDILNLSDVV